MMRQVVLRSPRHLELDEVAPPQPAAGELLVEVKATAICGTDLHVYTGQTPVTYPRVLGHECTGIVKHMGPGVTAFQIGDPVVINPCLDCGNCELCLVGKENLCVGATLMGRESDGTLRECLTIPQTHAFKLPSHASFEAGALIQPLSTVVHAQRLTSIKATESVVVLGMGASGLLHIQLAKLAGAYPVIAVGRSPWKLELALQMGADLVVKAMAHHSVAEVIRLTGGLGTDVVIEAVGIPETFQQALEMSKPGGRVVGFGISPQALPSLNLYRLYRQETTLLFPRATTRADFHHTVALVASKRIVLRPLLTREYALEEARRAFAYAEQEQSRVLRLVIKP